MGESCHDVCMSVILMMPYGDSQTSTSIVCFSDLEPVVDSVANALISPTALGS